MRANQKRDSRLLCWMLSAFIALTCVIGGCKDDNGSSIADALPFDPSKPVVVSNFNPKAGGMGQRLVIFGKNFGNDPDSVSVFIGGKKAVVISVEGESLYCLVPGKAYRGDVEVRVGTNDKQVIGKTDMVFDYQRKLVVSTVIGYRNDRGDEPWMDGKFKDKDQNKMASGFWNPSTMRFDPLNPKHLWVVFDGNRGLYLINFEDSTVTQKRTDLERPRSLDFTLDGKYMIIAEDRGGNDEASTQLLSRENDWQDKEILTKSRQCNGATVHPVNGEMYYNSYGSGEFFRYDLNQYFNGGLGFKGDIQFVVQDPEWEYKVFIHPSGNYAYIVVINKHYILRCDYNWEKKVFNQPYLVCGQLGAAGYEDGVGSTARLRVPYQGVFVKNPAYVAQAKPDEYDFYFTELDNHDIRILTPQGSVTTFAGRGSSSINGDPWGYVDGDLRKEARFDRPTGLAYNEAEGAFYVGDYANRRFRKIALEEVDEVIKK
ncbi:IPT/TIG domain-containing protein [Arcticibacter eurypsychrophilus]|uniref:IPT/TIG domain-containing protein n=1 Tax=Arcticibacter eurypsychrophilus TaxID=1434752 RepID=UPI00084CF9CC|nr:IPT/TIG domain-containing protein [Arcticibacter eurypsychrophilus]